MAGGIGITPMIAMAHRLHELGAKFELHYSGRSENSMGFVSILKGFSWSSNVIFHITDQGSRAEFSAIFAVSGADAEVYTCGAEPYMQAVLEAAEQAGVPEERRHLE